MISARLDGKETEFVPITIVHSLVQFTDGYPILLVTNFTLSEKRAHQTDLSFVFTLLERYKRIARQEYLAASSTAQHVQRTSRAGDRSCTSNTRII